MESVEHDHDRKKSHRIRGLTLEVRAKDREERDAQLRARESGKHQAIPITIDQIPTDDRSA